MDILYTHYDLYITMSCVYNDIKNFVKKKSDTQKSIIVGTREEMIVEGNLK